MDGLDEIAQLIKEKKCIPFLGAGTSIVAGCSNWNSIPAKLQALPELKETSKRMSPLITTEQKIRIFHEELIKIGEEAKFDNIMRKVLHCDVRKVQDKYGALIEPIEKIFLYTKILLTTNIDNCLEATSYFHPDKNYPFYFSTEDFKVTSLSRGGIYFIHGNRDDRRNSVLTDETYKERYGNLGFENFLGHVFKHYTILFIGKNLKSDKPLMSIIEKMKDRIHFAFTGPGRYSAEEKTAFRVKYNIKIIEYVNHDSLPGLLRQLIDNDSPEISAQTLGEEDVTHAIR